MMFDIRIDDFGTTYLQNIDSKQSVDEVYLEIEKHKKPNKGIILIGFLDEIINGLKSVYEIIYLTIKDNQSYYLLTNNSNCPHFCDGKIYASGLSIIIKYQDEYFAILMKDKTKKILTCIGGTCTQEDYTHDKTLMTTAMRELMEETSGYTKITPNARIIRFCNKTYPLKYLLTANFESSYYGLKVDDTYICYGLYIDADKFPDEFTESLFNPKNEDKNSNYRMKYIDHEETEYIYATRINFKKYNECSDFRTIVQQIYHDLSQIKLSDDAKISLLHMFFNFINFENITQKPKMCIDISDKILFSEIKLHPSLKRIFMDTNKKLKC